MLMFLSASLLSNLAGAPGVFGSSTSSTSAFVVPQPTLAKAFLALLGSSTMRWLNPSLSRGGGERGIAIDFPGPKNWCDMSEPLRTVFFEKHELLCSCHMTAPLQRSGRLWASLRFYTQ